MFITIDGKPCECAEGEFVLAAALRNGIDIPRLCHHAALPNQASCRLCLVEIMENGVKHVTASCSYPVSEGIEVVTRSQELQKLRSGVLALLKERAPASPEISALCEKFGVAGDKRFFRDTNERCVMCGLCTAACKLLGASAISAAFRGVDKKISTPFGEMSPACIGCGACARVCPCGAIPLTESGGAREIWGKSFELVRCPACGKPFATREELAFLAKKFALPPEFKGLCRECQRKETVKKMPELRNAIAAYPSGSAK
ncbi:MAG: (2Fe-2S)-binding protein [Clostridiales bacterium]|jgi:NADH dehydrogenase/NADH:ubiquinone oxidoreductase subunit G|nr:(2Fe-2S)-binding protein [Clostridiales bacterium]